MCINIIKIFLFLWIIFKNDHKPEKQFTEKTVSQKNFFIKNFIKKMSILSCLFIFFFSNGELIILCNFFNIIKNAKGYESQNHPFQSLFFILFYIEKDDFSYPKVLLNQLEVIFFQLIIIERSQMIEFDR